jgi:hypothetical protein
MAWIWASATAPVTGVDVTTTILVTSITSGIGDGPQALRNEMVSKATNIAAMSLYPANILVRSFLLVTGVLYKPSAFSATTSLL